MSKQKQNLNISECRTRFWGLNCDAGKKYPQNFNSKLFVTMASLDPFCTDKGINQNPFVTVLVEQGKEKYLICTLKHKTVMNTILNLVFDVNDTVTFSVQGAGKVSLSGYEIISRENSILSDSVESPLLGKTSPSKVAKDASAEPSKTLQTNKKGKENKISSRSTEESVEESKEPLWKKFLAEENSEDDSSDDSSDEDFDIQKHLNSESDDQEEDISDEQEDDEDEEENEEEKTENGEEDEEEEENERDEDNKEEDMEDEDSNEEEDSALELKGKSDKTRNKRKTKMAAEVSTKRIKEDTQSNKHAAENAKRNAIRKLKKKKRNSIMNANANKDSSISEDDSNSDAEETKVRKCITSNTPKKEHYSVKLQGGVEIEDIRLGSGPVAMEGRIVHVYYIGRLQSREIFDSRVSPKKPLSFQLGRNEVIKGWEVGVKGMRVGGKRNLKIPPNMGYGNKRLDIIPPNSTLYFTVELMNVQ